MAKNGENKNDVGTFIEGVIPYDDKMSIEEAFKQSEIKLASKNKTMATNIARQLLWALNVTETKHANAVSVLSPHDMDAVDLGYVIAESSNADNFLCRTASKYLLEGREQRLNARALYDGLVDKKGEIHYGLSRLPMSDQSTPNKHEMMTYKTYYFSLKIIRKILKKRLIQLLTLEKHDILNALESILTTHNPKTTVGPSIIIMKGIFGPISHYVITEWNQYIAHLAESESWKPVKSRRATASKDRYLISYSDLEQQSMTFIEMEPEKEWRSAMDAIVVSLQNADISPAVNPNKATDDRFRDLTFDEDTDNDNDMDLDDKNKNDEIIPLNLGDSFNDKIQNTKRKAMKQIKRLEMEKAEAIKAKQSEHRKIATGDKDDGEYEQKLREIEHALKGTSRNNPANLCDKIMVLNHMESTDANSYKDAAAMAKTLTIQSETKINDENVVESLYRS